MRRQRTTFFGTLAAAVAALGMALPAAAGQVKLDVALAQPFLKADKKQTTFVKVGLTGFKLKTEKDRAAVNIVLVLDRSGSMRGEKLAKAKEAAILAIQRLAPTDIVSVVTYDNNVNVLVPATKLTDKASVIARIRQIQAGGSTALFAGVAKGAAEVRKFLDKQRANRVILLSDGLANVGPQTPSELGALGASLIKEGISVTTLGLGGGYNEDLMTELARRSDGNHAFIEKAADLAQVFEYEFNDVLSVVAQGVNLRIRCAKGVRPVRVLNRDAAINGQDVHIKLNQIYSMQEKYIMLEVEVQPGEAHTARSVASVDLSYHNMATNTEDKLASRVSVRFTESAKEVVEKTNKNVMIACVAQKITITNKLAVELRDQGKVEQARVLLQGNSKYAADNAGIYGGKILKDLGIINWDDAANLDDENWRERRKMMRKKQHEVREQQSY